MLMSTTTAIEGRPVSRTTASSRAKRSSAPTCSGISSRPYATSSAVDRRRTERALAEAREVALKEMQARANELGANGVIGIDLDYEVLGSSNGMLMVSVSGTAVTV